MPGKSTKYKSEKDGTAKLENTDVPEKFSETRVILQTFVFITCVKCLLDPT